MKKSDFEIFEEILNAAGKEKSEKLIFEAVRQKNLYKVITENLLFSDEKYERMDMSFLVNISSLDYGKQCRVILIKNENSNTEIYGRISDELRDKNNILLTTVWEGLLIGILPEKLTETSDILKIYHSIQEKFCPIKMAVSTIKENLEDCHMGFQEAIRTYDMIETMKTGEENMLFYEDLGIWRLLYELKDDAIFKSYYNSVFRDIWIYDENNDGHLFETLECYFDNNCDKVTTAQKLFVHENTLRYRLHQIEDIIHKDLKDVNVIADIVTAFKVRRMSLILEKK